MRCNALFYAVLLPGVALAQFRTAEHNRPTGPSAHGRDNATHIHGGNHTRPLNGSFEIEFNHTTGPSKASGDRAAPIPVRVIDDHTHHPYNKSLGFRFSNATEGFQGPTGTGPFAHPSGTGAPKSKKCRLSPSTTSSAAAEESSGADFTTPSAETPTSAGRLPFSKSAGLVFTNSTSGAAAATAASFHPSGTGVSSGFAKPTCHKKHHSHHPSATGRLPFTKSVGAAFTNTTSSGPVATDVPVPTESAVVEATSTEVVLPVAVVSTSAASSGTAKPYTKPTGPLFTNSTLSAFPSGTAASTGFATLTSSALPTGTGAIIAHYYQCGGINWKGNGTCIEGTVCKYWNPYYSQCVSE